MPKVIILYCYKVLPLYRKLFIDSTQIMSQTMIHTTLTSKWVLKLCIKIIQHNSESSCKKLGKRYIKIFMLYCYKSHFMMFFRNSREISFDFDRKPFRILFNVDIFFLELNQIGDSYSSNGALVI